MSNNNAFWGDERDSTQEILSDIGFHSRDEWRSAPAIFDEHTLKIFELPVMEDWETPYMEALAKIATINGGTVLELGFGMGISAKFIQQAQIEKHIIIEANHKVAEKANEFRQNATTPVVILEGFWEDVIDQIPDESIDGILFDTYPLSELEVHKNHFFFFPTAYKKLKKSGVFTYYSDEIDSFHNVHLQKLIEAGFKEENIKGEIVSVEPPKDCQYWQSNKMLAPIIIK